MLNRHFSIYLGANLIPAVIGFVAITVFTRLLNPSEYGVYVVGMSIAGILGGAFFAWIRLSVARYQATSEAVDFRTTASVAYGATVIAVFCTAPVAILLLGPDVNLFMLFGSLSVALAVGAFDIAQEFSRANLKPVRYAIAGISRSVFGFGLGWLAIRLGWGGVGLLGSVAFSFLIGALVTMGSAYVQAPPFQSKNLMKFVRYGLPLALGGLSISLYSVSDRLVVAYLLGDSAAGNFGVAADLPRQFLVMLASSVTAATFPIVFRSFTDEGVDATRARLKENAELLLAVVVPVSVWLALAADQIAGTLVGASFRANVSVLLPILAVGRLLGVINQFYLQISFQLAERPFLAVLQSIITLVLSIVLMFSLVAQFGLIGAAYATMITEAAGSGIGILMTRRAFPLPFEPRRLAKVLACAAAMGGAIVATRMVVGGTGLLSLMIVSAAGGLVYAGSAWLLDVVRVRTAATSYLRFGTVHP